MPQSAALRASSPAVQKELLARIDQLVHEMPSPLVSSLRGLVAAGEQRDWPRVRVCAGEFLAATPGNVINERLFEYQLHARRSSGRPVGVFLEVDGLTKLRTYVRLLAYSSLSSPSSSRSTADVA